jgi:hypothetical protein
MQPKVHVSVPCSLFAALLSVARPVLQATGYSQHAGPCQRAVGVSHPAGYCRLLEATSCPLHCCAAAPLPAAPLHHCTAALQATSAQALTAPVAARRSARSANQPNSQPANALTPSWPAALLHRCTAEAHALTAPVAAAPTLTQCS